MVFMDLERANDGVLYKVLWNFLEKKGLSVTYIQVIKDMYDAIKMSVRSF